MAYKVAKGEREEAVNIRDALKEKTEPRLMCELSDRFSKHKAGNVEGVVLRVNEELLKSLGINEGDIVKKFSLFVDWSGRYADQELLGLRGNDRSLSSVLKLPDKTKGYADIKGGGLVKVDVMQLGLTIHKRPETIERRGSSEVRGLLDRSDAEADWDATSEFLKAGGIRTAEPLVIIELREAIKADGSKASIEELKEKGAIPEKFAPVLYARVFHEVMRIYGASRKDFVMFAREHGMTLDGYVDWWISMQAENLARIHKLGKWHGNLIEQNLTMDGRIVDNDTVRPIERQLISLPSAHDYIGMVVGPSSLYDINNLISGVVELPSRTERASVENAASFLRKYLESRTDMGKDEFKDIFNMFDQEELKTTLISRLNKEGRELFEKRFGEM